MFDSFLRKIKKYFQGLTSNQISTFFMFVIMWGVLLLQHRMVGMYYDDFGNASLSYGYNSNVVGTNYSVKDLLDWATYIYMNWSGRIIYALMLIPLLKTGAHIFMFIQTIIIILIMNAMYVYSKKYMEKSNGILLIIGFMLIYSLLQGDILTQGIYWASASVLYVWPMLPFMLTIWMYGIIEEKIKKNEKIKLRDCIGLIFSIPLVTLSQEQLGGALIVWFIFNMLFKYYKDEKRYWKADLYAISYCIITFGIFFCAPGNWARLATNEEYANKSFLEKLIDSFPKVLNLLTNYSLKYFNLILLLVGVIVLIQLKQFLKNRYLIIFGAGIIPFFITIVDQICNRSILSKTYYGITFFIFLIDMFVILMLYFTKKKHVEFMATMIAGVASVFCLILSPAFSLRSCIPYVFICMILFVIVINDFFTDQMSLFSRKIIGLIIGILGLIGIINVINIYKGYENNYYIDNYNFNILKEYDGSDDIIYLVKYPNNLYRGTMSCDVGYEYIDYWVKEYFAIPQSVMIKWKSMSELLDYARMSKVDIDYDTGFYDDEGGYRWAENNAKLIISNNSKHVKKVIFSSNIYTGYEENSKVLIKCNGESIWSEETNKDGKLCEIEVKLQPGDNVFDITTDAKQIITDGDVRKLFMRFVATNCEEEF